MKAFFQRVYIKVMAWLVLHGFLRVLLFLGLVRILAQGRKWFIPAPDYPRKHRRTWLRCPICSRGNEMSVRCYKPGVPAHPNKYALAATGS